VERSQAKKMLLVFQGSHNISPPSVISVKQTTGPASALIGGGRQVPAMFLQAEKTTPGQRAEAADALRVEESRKALARGENMKNLKGTFARALSVRRVLDTLKLDTQESEASLAALNFQEQLNANLQEQLTGLMDMVESQSECIRGLEATATQANARIRELEAQVKEGGGMVRERVRSGGLVKIGEGAISADGRYNIGARSGDGTPGGMAGSPHRRRRTSGEGGQRRRRVASSVASGSSAQTV